jgi:predicted metal-dependent HD superfamily phosphohydrolase
MAIKYLDRWEALLIQFSVSQALIAKSFADIVLYYGESGRYYHNLSHIQHVLEVLDELQPLADNFAAIQLAAWFHDIIYNTRTPDNEVQSAVHAESVLMNLSIPIDTIRKVNQMIMATAKHLNPTNDPDTYLLLDADLAILGSNEAAFTAYCDAIRKEYKWVADSDYRSNRIKVLNRFLERPRIYQTQPLYKQLETQARKNLLMEIGRLS